MACLPPRVGICMPGVIVDLFPLVFLIEEAAPTPVSVPTLYIVWYYNHSLCTPPTTAIRYNAAQGATVGAKRGCPKRGNNKDGAKKPGRNARTAPARKKPSKTREVSPVRGYRVPAHHRREPALHRRVAGHHGRLPTHHLQAGSTAAPVAEVGMVRAAV